MKKFLAVLLAVALLSVSSVCAFAETPQLLDLQDVSSQEEMNQIMAELNDYLDTHTSPFELKAATNKYTIPLSNGQYVEVETTLEQVSSSPMPRGGEYINANLGDWRYGVAYKVNHGKVDIHIIYNVSSTIKNGGELIFEFVSSGIEGVPFQLTSVSAEEITTETNWTNHCYSEGYVTFDVYGAVPFNMYADLYLGNASNMESSANYGKIITDYHFNVV